MEYTSENKTCQNCKASFAIEPDDFSFYEKIGVPAPTFCPACRKQRRLAWRNDFVLHNNICKLCNKKIVSVFSEESGMNTYCVKCWWSDAWTAEDYAQDYDFSRNFFEQYVEFIKKVPVLAVVNDNGIGSVNCEYTHDFSFSKDCYMTFVSWKGEHLMYVYYDLGGKYIVDSLDMLNGGEFLYENVFTDSCYKCCYAQNSVQCSESNFIYDCKNCIECLMCTGLRNKRYCYKNVQYTKEEYERIVQEYKLDTYTGVLKAKEEFAQFVLSQIRKPYNTIHCSNCTGDLLLNGKNSKYCFNVQRPEDSKWIENSDSPTECYDLSTGGELSLCYEGITPDHSHKNFFGIFSWKNQEVEFAHHCHSSKYVFACAGIRNGEYMVFNKRYSREEYYALVDKIKAQMKEIPYVDSRGLVYAYGEFLPAELSYFGYDETIAPLHFPLTKEEQVERGYVVSGEQDKTIGKETVSFKDVPDSIYDAKDTLVNEIFACNTCSRSFRLIQEEFSFYRRMNIPLPRQCFYCRLHKRLSMKNPYELWHRSCMKEGCTNEFETSYAPDRPETVYCESCYQKEVL